MRQEASSHRGRWDRSLAVCPFSELPCQAELWPDCPVYGICMWLRGVVDEVIYRNPGLTVEEAIGRVRGDGGEQHSEAGERGCTRAP